MELDSETLSILFLSDWKKKKIKCIQYSVLEKGLEKEAFTHTV